MPALFAVYNPVSAKSNVGIVEDKRRNCESYAIIFALVTGILFRVLLKSHCYTNCITARRRVFAITTRVRLARPAKKLSGTARRERDPLRWASILLRIRLPEPSKYKRIAKGFEDRPEESCGQINFSAAAVVKQDLKSISRAGTHAHNSIHSSTPAAR